MPITDALGYVHGTGNSVGPITNNGGVYGDPLCAAGSQYSNLELDNGRAAVSPSSFPFIAQFPSVIEAGYTFPPEVFGQGGAMMGLHIIVGSAFNTLTSIQFQVCTSATTGALYTASPNPIAARTLSLAQLQVAGAHYFIPVQGSSVLEFLRFYAALTGAEPTSGTITSWFGPVTGGEE